ncbi:MAG TPA: SDR family oxidoreductase [bacterium]
MSNSLQGKTVLVTGGAVRLGAAICGAFAGEGANVVIHYKSSPDGAESLADELNKSGIKTWMIQANLSDPKIVGELINEVVDLTGGIDVLVNSAATFREEKLSDLTMESLQETIRLIAWAPFELTRKFAASLKKGNSGAVVNILDTRINGLDMNHAGYILAKHVLHQMTRMLAVEYGPILRVNAVAPGAVLPPGGKDESYLEELVVNLPLNYAGTPGDVADAVVFLAKSNFITGQVIYTDGGRHIVER